MRLLISFCARLSLTKRYYAPRPVAGWSGGGDRSVCPASLDLCCHRQPNRSGTGCFGRSFRTGTGSNRSTLAAVGLTPTLGVLLVVIVLAIVLKSGLVLLAKKQVGYTVADVATDLRLALLRALLVARWEYFLRQPIGALANSMATEANRTSKAYLHGAYDVAACHRGAGVYGCGSANILEGHLGLSGRWLDPGVHAKAPRSRRHGVLVCAKPSY